MPGAYDHPDPTVVIALTTYERSGGVQTAVIVRDDRGFDHRTLNGRPVPNDVSDEDLILQVFPIA